MVHKITLHTGKREQMIDITDQVLHYINQNSLQEGIVLIYCPHTTAAITINENADPDVVHDILIALDKVYPRNCNEYHHREGNSAAHLKASALGSSQFVPVSGGHPLLGTWQGIYFCEFDGPRQRSCYIKLIKE